MKKFNGSNKHTTGWFARLLGTAGGSYQQNTEGVIGLCVRASSSRDPSPYRLDWT